MPFENANFIKDLDADNPVGNDEISLGDDHIRSLKRVFDNTFSGLEGTTGDPKAITKTEDQINDAPEASSDLQEISGNWEFSGEITFSGGQFAIHLNNGTVLNGLKQDGTTNVPLAFVSDGGPTLDKAIFGASNAESVYEGDGHEFLGDITTLLGQSTPGNITAAGGLTGTAVSATVGDVTAAAEVVVGTFIRVETTGAVGLSGTFSTMAIQVNSGGNQGVRYLRVYEVV